MAKCLIALGSNLGDRGAILRDAIASIDGASDVRLVARSRWHETTPVGGPGGQEAFLNGAALVATSLDVVRFHGELVQIEQRLGRVRAERWAARSIDLDLLLYDREQCCDSIGVLAVPHPRMHWRRFVLAPAAEIAPWMVHPSSGWTVNQLLRQLDAGSCEAAIAGDDAAILTEVVAHLNERLQRGRAELRVRPWRGGGWTPGPRILMAIATPPSTTGTSEPERRRMLSLPETGPIAWLGSRSTPAVVAEAWTVLASAFPELAG